MIMHAMQRSVFQRSSRTWTFEHMQQFATRDHSKCVEVQGRKPRDIAIDRTISSNYRIIMVATLFHITEPEVKWSRKHPIWSEKNIQYSIFYIKFDNCSNDMPTKHNIVLCYLHRRTWGNEMITFLHSHLQLSIRSLSRQALITKRITLLIVCNRNGLTAV